MKTIHVSAGRSYDVITGRDLLKNAGSYIKSVLSPELCAVVTDDNVDRLYADALIASLEKEGIKTVKYVFPHGERSKNSAEFISLVEFLAASGLTRTDAVVALGGGVAGDLAGFAAASYMRGIGLVQIPTTLLAMVDSSVGGKTAIDLPSGKNLCGAFYQPHLVLCDLDLLRSLPEDVFLDGCGEVIKYGCIASPELFEHLEEKGTDFDRDWVIPLCISIKRDVVNADEFDRGMRQVLNFGHTFGHALELACDFALSHGSCVALGMAVIAHSSYEAGFCTGEYAERIAGLISGFGFNMNHGKDPDSLIPLVYADKKRSGSNITAVIPEALGRCILKKMPASDFTSFIKSGAVKWK